MIPLLTGLGITAGMATGATGIGPSSHLFRKLSLQLIGDVKTISSTIYDSQLQLDSLAEVAL